MPTIPPSTGVLGQQTQQTPYRDAFGELGMDDFLKMMLAELQNQDPLNPMDNGQILQQIGHIRDIVASDRLTETLESVFLGQNLATASSMIGRSVVATSDNSWTVAGRVNGIFIVDGKPKLYVGDYVVDLKDVQQILDEPTDTESDPLTKEEPADTESDPLTEEEPANTESNQLTEEDA